MRYFAQNCTSLVTLGVPDISRATVVGNNGMRNYAQGCTALETLSIPSFTALTTVGSGFMSNYASNDAALDFLVMDSAPGWFSTHTVSWDVAAAAATDEEGLKAIVPADSLTDWQALTASGKTLATNRITDPANVIVAKAPGLGPNSGDIDDDGVVTAADAISAAQAVISGNATPEQLAAADIDGDGKLTMADVIKIVRLVVGLQ
jgi:hypothetical protein